MPIARNLCDLSENAAGAWPVRSVIEIAAVAPAAVRISRSCWSERPRSAVVGRWVRS